MALLPVQEPVNRGFLIAVEGCDKSGKTTHCLRLAVALDATYMTFPSLDTPIGLLLHEYLKNGTDCEDHAVHLLSSAHRWEKAPEIKRILA